MKAFFLQEFYWPYRNKTYSYAHSVAIGFFTFALCFWVRPYDLELYFAQDKLFYVSLTAAITNVFFIGFVNIFGVPLFLPQHYLKWTIGKEILWTSVVVFSTCSLTPFVMEFFFSKDELFLMSRVFYMSTWAYAASIVPLVFSVLINQMRYQLIKSNDIKVSLKEQSNPNSKIESDKELTENTTIIPSEKGEYVLDLENVILIKSNANYSEIYLAKNESIHIDKIRCTLTTIDGLIKQYEFMFRCHRTYIINMKKINNRSGTASKGFVLTNNLIDFEVPVSRTKGKEFKENPYFL